MICKRKGPTHRLMTLLAMIRCSESRKLGSSVKMGQLIVKEHAYELGSSRR